MTYRVIQWATGAMGKTCLRAILDHPDLELAGLYVHSDRKVGRDAGEIARRQTTGILATKSFDEILAIDADVVLHCPLLRQSYNFYDSDICRLLASGKNVISINNYFSYQNIAPDIASPLLASCHQGKATLAGTGLNPGFVAERIAAVASGVCLDLESITTREVFDCIGMPSNDYVFGVMGMGVEPDKIDLKKGGFAIMFRQMYSQSINALASSLGLTLDSIEADNQITLAPENITARAGVIYKGTIAATNWQHHGIVNGKRVITHSVNWVMGANLPGYKDSNHWDIQVKGKPGLKIQMNLTEAENDSSQTKAEQYAVAAMVIQSIPLVVKAKSGFYTFPISPTWSARFN